MVYGLGFMVYGLGNSQQPTANSSKFKVQSSKSHVIHRHLSSFIASYFPRLKLPPSHIKTFCIFALSIKPKKMDAKRILLAEDDMNLGKVLSTVLTGKGFDVKHANNGEAAYELFCTNEFDLCLIDVMMPLKDGFTLAQEIRKMDGRIPIIFLTAKTLQEDMIKGLSIGGDDYITKPFTMEVLLARMQALLRRTGLQEEPESHIVNIGTIQFDRKRQILIVNGEEQKMTTREAALLDMLYEKRNDVLYRSYALKKIWGEDSFYNSRNMDVYITRLRKLLKSEPNVQIINVHSTGFKLVW